MNKSEYHRHVVTISSGRERERGGGYKILVLYILKDIIINNLRL